jgi:hypothetical protein
MAAVCSDARFPLIVSRESAWQSPARWRAVPAQVRAAPAVTSAPAMSISPSSVRTWVVSVVRSGTVICPGTTASCRPVRWVIAENNTSRPSSFQLPRRSLPSSAIAQPSASQSACSRSHAPTARSSSSASSAISTRRSVPALGAMKTKPARSQRAPSRGQQFPGQAGRD